VVLDVHELVAALPEDVEEELRPHDPLRAMLAGLSTRPIPVGAWNRFWVLGTLQAKIALAYLAYWIRSSYSDVDENARRLNEVHLSAALRTLAGMSYLRGAIMKVGQTLASYPNVVPSQFVDALGKLCFEAPPMHYALIREYLFHELGGDPEEVFAEFERTAFAAASLGQVHRARLHTGETVAVKVQYPNIARTIQSDFRNLLALLTPMRLTKDWDSIREQLEDVRLIFDGETDYQRELGFLERARSVFTAEDGIVVPKAYPQHCTSRVLTMEYLDGVHLDSYLATDPTQKERDRFGALMMRASFRLVHKGKFWYSDSNPGNYLFLRDGRLGIIDFGCCREFTADEWDFYIQVWNVYKQDGAGLREAMIRAADLDPNQPLNEEHIRFLEEYSHWYSDYLRYDEPFDFGDEEFMRRGIDLMTEVGRKRYFRSMPVNVWISRQLLGLRAIAFRLKARINMKRIGKEETWDLLERKGNEH